MNRDIFIESRLPQVRSLQPMPVRIIAHVLSVVFHPLFVPFYVCLFLEFVHPSYFSGFGISGKRTVLLSVTLNAVLFPLITVLLLKALGFIESIFFKSQKDRILLYISSMTFFFWAQYSLREQTYIPRILVAFITAVVLLLLHYLFVNFH